MSYRSAVLVLLTLVVVVISAHELRSQIRAIELAHLTSSLDRCAPEPPPPELRVVRIDRDWLTDLDAFAVYDVVGIAIDARNWRDGGLEPFHRLRALATGRLEHIELDVVSGGERIRLLVIAT